MGKVRYKDLSKSESSQDLQMTLPHLRGQATQEVHALALGGLHPFPGQARKHFNTEELHDLQKSIHALGIITPLLVAKAPQQGQFYVINGERRLRAAKALGLQKVPCLILAETSHVGLIALTDNVQRVNLHPLELAEACEPLIHSHGDMKKVAEKLGISYTSLSETMKLRLLPPQVQKLVLDRNLTSRIMLRQLMKMSSERDMLAFLKPQASPSKHPKKRVMEIFIQDHKSLVVYGRYTLNTHEKNALADQLTVEAQRLKASCQPIDVT